MRQDPTLPLVFTHGQALARGFTESKILRRIRSGAWRTLRRGVYCLAVSWEQADAARRHRIECGAAVLGIAGQPVVSHASAAVLHGLPLPFRSTGVWLTRESRWCTRYLEGLTVESAPLPLEHLDSRHGLSVTGEARTVADCLRHLDDVDATVVADAALRRRPDLLEAVVEVLEGCREWPYALRAAQRLPMLDGRRESPAESRSYVAMHRRGIPLPEPQVVVCGADGAAIGRVDGWWEEFAAIAEVDGAVKYGIGSDVDHDAAKRALVREKQREDRLRRTGATVIRWGVADLRNEARWAAAVREQLRAADRSRFRGSVIRPGSSGYLASGFGA